MKKLALNVIKQDKLFGTGQTFWNSTNLLYFKRKELIFSNCTNSFAVYDQLCSTIIYQKFHSPKLFRVISTTGERFNPFFVGDQGLLIPSIS